MMAGHPPIVPSEPGAAAGELESQPDANDLCRPRFQRRDGRIEISWRLLGFFVWVFVAIAAMSALFRQGPGYAAVMTGLFLLLPYLNLRGSTPKHRFLVLAAFVLVFAAPVAAVYLLPEPERHHWLPAYPVAAGAVAVILTGYLAASRMPGWFPPLAEPERPRYRAARPWTIEERRALLAGGEPVVIRHRWFSIWQCVILGTLSVTCLGLAIAAFINHVWFGGVVLIPTTATLVYATMRSPRVALILNAGDVTIRNTLGTHIVAWENIRDIVPPDDDWFGRLRFKLTSGRSLSSGGLTNGGLQRRTGSTARVELVMKLWGPSHSS